MQEPLITSVTQSSTPNTAQTVFSLLPAGSRPVCCELTLQADVSGGTAKYAVASSSSVAVTTGTAGTGVGVQLTAGGSIHLGPFSSNLIHLAQIYLACNAASGLWNIEVAAR